MADDTTIGDGDDLTLDAAAPGRSARGQRRALWAALAVVALAAGTVVVSTGGEDDGGLPVLPVSLAGGARELSADSAAGLVPYQVHSAQHRGFRDGRRRTDVKCESRHVRRCPDRSQFGGLDDRPCAQSRGSIARQTDQRCRSARNGRRRVKRM